MSVRVSTAGMFLCYATTSSSSASMPTTGYKKVPEIKSIPSFNPAPETIESTTLEETEYKTYVPGLKDVGGALEFGANLTDDLVTFWDTVLSDYTAAVAANGKMYWAVAHPKLAKATFFEGEPSPLGLNEAAVSSMAETTLYITPTGAPFMASKPTTT